MITNGSLFSLAPPAAPGADGATAWGTAVSVGVRCQLGEVTASQKYALGEAIQDATAVMYEQKSVLGVSGAVPTQGGQAVAATDGGAARTYRIEYVIDRQGGLAHYQVFLRY